MLIVLVPLLLAQGGCLRPQKFPVAPPCALVAVENPQRTGVESSGQAVWVGNRVLTMGHVFTALEGDALPPSVLLNWRRVPVRGYRSGDLEAVRRTFGAGGVMPAWSDDWIGFEVPFAAPEHRMPIGDGTVRLEEKLYIVGFDGEKGDDRLSVIPVYVIRGFWRSGGERHPFPDRTIAVASTRGMPERKGWSGAFVGRYDEQRRQWEYVGQLSASISNKKGVVCYAVVRPPSEALLWLMGEGD